jgi:hypothetical protein
MLSVFYIFFKTQKKGGKNEKRKSRGRGKNGGGKKGGLPRGGDTWQGLATSADTSAGEREREEKGGQKRKKEGEGE